MELLKFLATDAGIIVMVVVALILARLMQLSLGCK